MATRTVNIGPCECCGGTGCCGCACENLIVTITDFKYGGVVIGAGPVSIVYTNNHDAVDGNNCTFEQPATDGVHIAPVDVTIGGTHYTEVGIAFGRVGCFTDALALPPGGTTTAMIMLGANDADADVSKATYKSSMSTLIANLITAGYTEIYLNSPGTSCIGPVPTLATSINGPIRLLEYADALAELVNGTTIRLGDPNSVALNAINALTSNWTFDELHPAEGAPYIGRQWAASFARSKEWLGTIGGAVGNIAKINGITVSGLDGIG